MPTTIALEDFIAANREELIERCRTKVRARPSPPPTDVELDHGVPLFLDQLVDELQHGPSQSRDISQGAVAHGHDLQQQGFTVGQVVHDYGDICQSITDLAVERASPISTDDFRTLNRCLDNAIAGAVTQYAREQSVTRRGTSDELRALVGTAITAFEVLQTGSVGVTGRTGTLVYRNLRHISEILNRPTTDREDPETV